MKKHYDIGVRLTRGERIAGFSFLPFYVVLLALLLSWVSQLTRLNLTEAQRNLIYYYVSFTAVVIIFHKFLAASLKRILQSFWPFVQAVILGFALYYAANLLLGLLLGWVLPDLTNPAEDAVISVVRQSGAAMLVCAVFLGPLVEETLLRGLIFGALQPRSRILAYVVSCLVFSVLHLWQYVGTVSLWTLAADLLLYLPGGVALAWTYEKSGCIWAPVLLHAFINALSLGLIQTQF